MLRHVLIAALLAPSLLPAQRAAPSLAHDDVLDERVVDTDGDGRDELVVVRGATPGRAAAVVRVTLTPDALQVRDEHLLADPAHTLLAIADVHAAPGEELVVCEPKGTSCVVWGAGEATDAVRLLRGARFALRVDQPLLSSFVRDFNDDGRPDLLLPSLNGVTPYLCDGAADGAPTYRGLPLVPVAVAAEVDPGGRGLDQELVGRLRIPAIETKDVNGDGRPDMLTVEGTVHKFHLQQSDGTFAAPIQVDLDQFEDSTPKAAIDLGKTAVLTDRKLMQSGDIDGDAIPDYVIAHRRKVWTFLASAAGPQFREVRTQAVADDVTLMRLVDIDEDGRSDLLTFRVRVPGVGALLLGLVQSIDVDVKAVGYPSADDGFARTPKWRRTITIRIPPLLSLLSRQDEFVERFTALIGKTRISARAHFRTAEVLDLAIATSDATTLELFVGVGEAPRLDAEGGRLMRRLIFEDEDTLFDVERLFAILSGFVDTVSARTVGDRVPTATVALRDPEQWRLRDLLPCDADGDGGDELLVVYEDPADPQRRVYDLINW